LQAEVPYQSKDFTVKFFFTLCQKMSPKVTPGLEFILHPFLCLRERRQDTLHKNQAETFSKRLFLQPLKTSTNTTDKHGLIEIPADRDFTIC